MHFVERTFQDALGATVIQSRLRPATDRRGYENVLFPSMEVGLAGWERAHSQGAGTGFESPHGIRYAPQEVNQHYQRLGIERILRELVRKKPADTDLWLTTVTSTHPRSLRLKEIQYRLDAVRGTSTRRIFEASIEIADTRTRPRVTAQATPFVMPF